MEYYKNMLCLTGGELILSPGNTKGVVLKSNYDKLVQRGRLSRVERSCNGKPSLIIFESIPKRYQEEWVRKNGEVKIRQAVDDIFISHYVRDGEAAGFYRDYRVEYGCMNNSTGLPEDRQEEYVCNASVLNTIGRVKVINEVARRKARMKSNTEFWEAAVRALERFREKGVLHTLPENPRRLHDRFDKYKKSGYGALVHRNYANVNSVKISDAAGEWLVAQWMSQRERVTMEQLFERYNQKAKLINTEAGEEHWKVLKSVNAIRLYLFRPEVERLWHAARYGELSSKEKYSRQNRTILPERRDSLWYSDGTKLNYFYRDEKGNIKTCSVYEVMDVYSECLLGYHISRTEDYEAQYEAYWLALQYSGCKPYEIRYDNQGGHRKLENSDLLKNLARLSIRTSPYNGKSKTIESVFGRFQSQFLHKDWFFTGQNVTATKKESKANMEFILANASKIPTLEEIKETYRQRRLEWNAAAHPKTGVAREQMYQTSVNDRSEKVNMLDLIDIFGITTPEAREYTAAGIELEIKGVRKPYEVLQADGRPDMDFNRRNIGRKFYRRYNPHDFSAIGLYDRDESGSLRFVNYARPYLKVHRAIQDQTASDVAMIRRTQKDNRDERIRDEGVRSALLEKHGLHPHQSGLNVAPLKGITSGRKQAKDIGQHLKDESELTAIAEAEKAERRAAQQAARAAEREELRKNEAARDEYMDFLRRKMEMEMEFIS